MATAEPETTEATEAKTALIKIEEINLPKVFTEGNIESILDFIREQVQDLEADVDTAKGRQVLKSAAYRVTRSKTLLDDAGKEFAADLKAQVASIDKNRRKIRTELDNLRDAVRKPLTDWEEAQARREQEIDANIARFTTAGQTSSSVASADLEAILEAVKAMEINEADFGDQQGEAAIAKDIAVSNLERSIAAAKKREAEAEELKQLREKQAEHDQRERQRRAEQEAQAKADAAAKAAVEKAEREAEAARAAQEKAEAEAEEARAAAARAQEEAAEQARRDEEARQEAERKRAEDREHRKKIHLEAIAAFREWTNLTEDSAGVVVTAIASGQISHIKIEY